MTKFGEPSPNQEKPERSRLRLWIQQHVNYPYDDCCLIWPFGRHHDGYGVLIVDGKMTFAHRYMCRLVNGEPPTLEHETVDHGGHLGRASRARAIGLTQGKTAYDRVMELKLAQKQAEQRVMSPQKIGQILLREWLGAYGMGGVIDPMAAADLVQRVETAIKAERATSINGEIIP